MFLVFSSQAKRTSFKEAKESESLTVQVEAARSRTTNEKELSKVRYAVYLFPFKANRT